MDNFFFGLQAVVSGSIDLIRRVAAHELFWGFSLGFLFSTLLHGFLLSEDPKHLPTMLLKDRAIAFQKMYPPDEKNKYHKSFQTYVKNANRIQFTFLISGILFGVLFLIVLLSW